MNSTSETGRGKNMSGDEEQTCPPNSAAMAEILSHYPPEGQRLLQSYVDCYAEMHAPVGSDDYEMHRATFARITTSFPGGHLYKSYGNAVANIVSSVSTSRNKDGKLCISVDTDKLKRSFSGPDTPSSRPRQAPATQRQTKCCSNKECGVPESEQKLRQCAQCFSVMYCSKECQVTDWHNQHKQECKQLAKKHDDDATTEILDPDLEYPFVEFTVDGSLAKIPRKFQFMVPLWDFQDDDFRRFVTDPAFKARQESKSLKVLKKFLKKYEQATVSGSEITSTCFHVLCLHWLGHPIVQVSSKSDFFLTKKKGKFGAFGCKTRVPKKWKLDTGNLGPAIINPEYTDELQFRSWKWTIYCFRNDPELGERDSTPSVFKYFLGF